MNSDMENINIGGWIFDLSNPLQMLIAGLLLISLLMTLQACWRRLYPGRPLRALLISMLNLLAFAAVFGLLTEPHRNQLVQQDVILITEGTDIDTAGQLSGPQVYVSNGVAATTKTRKTLKNTNWLLDVAQLPLREPALNDIDIRGYGLTREQWQEFPAVINISFQAPAISGFTDMHWPRSLLSGETLPIGGRYTIQQGENPVNGAIIDLALLDPVGNIVDETRIRNGAHFSLAARPRGRGNLNYTLQSRMGDTLLAEQTVSTSVGTAASIKIMVQQSAPSFETRQLKNFAAGQGAQVLVNTQISRGKSISQSIHLPVGSETSFSPASLATQDVLIMDGRALVNLAEQQRQWLSDAVEQGLGLVVIADASLVNAPWLADDNLLTGFALTADPNAKTEVVLRLLSNSASRWQQPIPVAAIQLQAADADRLIDDHHDNAMVVNKAYGLGQITITLISKSHRWLTSGQREQWSEYWATLIDAAGRARDDSYLLPQTDAAFFEAGETIPVCAMSATESLVISVIPAVIGAGQVYEVRLTADTLGSPRQCGWFQARHAGWHQLQLRSLTGKRLLDQQGIYIQKDGQWLAQKRQLRVDASNHRLANNTTDTVVSQRGKWVSKPVSSMSLWLLLVLCASLLWLERKLDVMDIVAPAHPYTRDVP